MNLLLTTVLNFRFTAQDALKFGLIPRLNSKLLEVVNNFEMSPEEYSVAAAEQAPDEANDIRNMATETLEMDVDDLANVEVEVQVDMGDVSHGVHNSTINDGLIAASSPLQGYVFINLNTCNAA